MKEKERKRCTFALIFIIGILIGGTFLSGVWAGGWEIQTSFYDLTVEGETVVINGKQSHTFDVDGDVDLSAWKEEDDYLKPDITVEKSGAHYIQNVNGEWALAPEPVILDEYDVDISDTQFQRYSHYAIGVDITIKTAADKYFKDVNVYKIGLPPAPDYTTDYGWFFEADDADVSTRFNFVINPWAPSGQVENWTVIDGWCGIMSASVADVEYGLVDEDATEDWGHTIQNLNSEGAQLTMYIDDAVQSPVSFKNTEALDGVPSAVQIELGATLAAGAEYDVDLLGHWTDVGVRNVYVKYKVRVDVLTTLAYAWELGHQDELKKPEEDNPTYPPRTFWDTFFEDLFGGLDSGTILIVIVLLLIGVVFICKGKKKQSIVVVKR